MDWTTIGGLAARHLLTAAGTWLITRGFLPAESADQFVGGGMILVGVLWSIIQKWRAGGLPLPPSAVRVLPLLALLPLLGACSAGSLQNASELLDRINARIATTDEVAHKLCPSLALLNASATTVACVAKANGTTQSAVAKVIAYGNQFCANPTSANLSSLAANAAVGLRAAMTATSAGCQ